MKVESSKYAELKPSRNENASPILDSIASDSQWHVSRNREKFGPYSFAQLKEHAASGRVVSSDMLLQVGAQKWIEARLERFAAGWHTE